MRTEEEIRTAIKQHEKELDSAACTFVFASQLRASRDSLKWVLGEV